MTSTRHRRRGANILRSESYRFGSVNGHVWLSVIPMVPNERDYHAESGKNIFFLKPEYFLRYSHVKSQNIPLALLEMSILRNLVP